MMTWENFSSFVVEKIPAGCEIIIFYVTRPREASEKAEKIFEMKTSLVLYTI